MAPRGDAHVAKQVVLYMERAIDLSPQALLKITRSSAVGPFVRLLASTDPGLMHAHLKGAEKELAASKKRLAKAEKAKQRQRESIEDIRPSKMVKHNPGSKSFLSGSSSVHVKVKSYLARRKPALGSRRGRSTTPDTRSTTSSARHTVHSYNEGGDDDESDDDDSCAGDDTPDSESSTRYKTEVGITNGTPAIIEPLMAHCIDEFKHVGMTSKANRERHVQEIFEACQCLDFVTAKLSLQRFLNDRSKVPGCSVELQSTWNIADAAEALDALQTIANLSADLRIHHAFTQMRLYTLVQEDAELTEKSPRYILNELVEKKAGDVSDLERRQLTKKYHAEYLAGGKWHDMASWFGGGAIVIVFVTADIAPYEVAHRWNLFQRQCMAYLSEQLYSTRRLVETLGEGALEYYCRHGRLTDEVREAIQDLDGYE